jgi:hypothetical protein
VLSFLPSAPHGAELANFLIAWITPFVALFAAVIAYYAIHNQKWLTVHKERARLLVDGTRSSARMDGAKVLATLYVANVGPTLASEVEFDASAEACSATSTTGEVASSAVWAPWVLGGSSIQVDMAFGWANVAGALDAVILVVRYTYEDFVGVRRQGQAKVRLPISSTRSPGTNVRDARNLP